MSVRALLVEEFTAVGSLHIREVQSPGLDRGQVRVRIKAAGVGFVDALKIGGRYQTKDPLPFVPGAEFAGVVAEIADGSTDWKVGDRVFGRAPRGAFADEIVVPAVDLAGIPDRLSFAQAAAVPVNYLTAVYALLELGSLKAGHNLLVLGAAGGTGTAAMKIGRMVGANVIAAAASDDKRSFALGQGADQVIDYTKDDWRRTLTAMTGEKPMDVVFDAVGGEISPVAFRTLGWRGRHLVVGFAAGSIPALPMNIALLKGASLVGVDVAQIRKWEPETHDRLSRDIVGWLNTGALAPPPVMTFPFARFQDAFEAIASRRALGKIVLEMAD